MFSPSSPSLPSSSSLHSNNKTTLPSDNITSLDNYNINMVNDTTNINTTATITTKTLLNNNNNSNDNNEYEKEKEHSLLDATTTTTTTTSRYTTATDNSIIDTEEDDEKSMTCPSFPYFLNDEQPITPTQILDIINSTIDDITLQEQLKTAIQEFSTNYDTRYTTLRQSFKNIKIAHEDMLHEMTIQQAHYDKAIREMRFYKAKYARLHQLHYRKQQQPEKFCNNNKNNTFLDEDDIIDWQRRIASSSSSYRRPSTPTRTRSQRNRSFVSENNESYCGSSSCSSIGDWTYPSAQNNIQNFSSFLPHTNIHPIHRHPTDAINYHKNNNNNEEEEEEEEEYRIINLVSVLAMSDQQQQQQEDRETMSTSSIKSLSMEIVGEKPNTPAPLIPLPPHPSYPPPTRTSMASSVETTKKDCSSSLQQDNSTSNNDSSSNKVLVDDNTTAGNTDNETPIDPIIKNRTMSLTFACGDGFWDTIARGKNNKVEVDSLISNYIRRGGQPNVAKNSSSLKSVKEGYGLIHALIAVKNASALSRVIEAGANPNAIALAPEELNRTTPLVLASQLSYLTGIRLLLERAQADIFQRGPRQMTALHAALEKGDDDVAIYLVRASKHALLDIVDVEGATPLHYACKYGRIKMMIMFIRDCHVKMDPLDNKGETPLHYAVRQRRLKMITRLVGDFGVYPNQYIFKQTPTPLDLAKSGGFKTIAEYLKKAGAKTTKEMEKTAHRGSSATATSSGSTTKSEKELSVQLSSTSTSHHSMNDIHTTTSHNNNNNNNNSGMTITTSSGVVLGTRISFSSSNISGTTTASSRQSVASSISGSASIHSSSNGSTMSRGSGTFSLSRASMNFRNNIFSHS